MKPLRTPKLTTFNTWRKRYKCKATKGDHKYVLTHANHPMYFMQDRIYEYYTCEACGKQDVKFVPW